MRVARLGTILFALWAAAGCRTVCEEVADEAEASGCGVGVPPGSGGAAAEEAPACEDAREARAQCLLDNTENVCALSAEEQKLVADCYAAEGVE